MKKALLATLLRKRTRMSCGMTPASLAGMRKTKPSRRRLGKIGMWFDACIANLSFLVLIALLGGLTFRGLTLFKKPSPPPVAILIVGQTNSASGATLTQVVFTNTSNHRFNYAFSAEVRKRGWWQNGSVRHRDSVLSPRSGHLLSLPAPQGGDEWRVTLVAHRALGGVESEVCHLFRRFNLEYPFAKEFQVSGPEMLNPSGKNLNSPQVAAQGLSLANGTN